jgi:hypothetical protein
MDEATKRKLADLKEDSRRQIEHTADKIRRVLKRNASIVDGGTGYLLNRLGELQGLCGEYEAAVGAYSTCCHLELVESGVETYTTVE